MSADVQQLLCTVTLTLPDSSSHFLKGCFAFDLYTVMSFDQWMSPLSIGLSFFSLLALDPVGSLTLPQTADGFC